MLALRGWKTRPLQHFGAPGPGKHDPYSTLGPPGLESATPTALWASRASLHAGCPGLEHATPPIVLKPWGWKVQPLLLFSRPGAGKCNPSCCFQALGLESATPPAVSKPWGWKVQPLLLFSCPGAGKCNPSCCFQAPGLESATPPSVFKPWGWKVQPLQLF